jgi:hypothetical protein
MSMKSNKYPEKGRSMNTYKVIPEHIMEASAEMETEMGRSDNSFSRMLVTAREFKDAGMTPMFLLDVKNMDVLCIAKETFGKKLH